ncbi:putative transcriptional regulator [Anopheles sinensis]|uniref:Putative transcriptional regulator n=1 Tax=Anopheles sinensis TaxID=74873 RepID=A0A084W328_ANOSI|nr:putative transcriptional regulator [Anopheles sinensis]
MIPMPHAFRVADKDLDRAFQRSPGFEITHWGGKNGWNLGRHQALRYTASARAESDVPFDAVCAA